MILVNNLLVLLAIAPLTYAMLGCSDSQPTADAAAWPDATDARGSELGSAGDAGASPKDSRETAADASLNDSGAAPTDAGPNDLGPSDAPLSTDAVQPTPTRQHACGVPLIEVEVDPTEFEEMNTWVWTKVELPARVTMFGHSFEGAEIEIHGGWARDQPKKSYRIKVPKAGLSAPEFDPFGDGPEPIRRLVLIASWNDATFARNKLSMDLAREMGAHAPRVSHAVLEVNGVFQGLYVLVERIDKVFLSKRSWSPDGNLYKAETHQANWQAKPNALDGFEKKTNEAGPHDDLAELLNALTHTTTEATAFAQQVEPRLDLQHHRVWNMVNTFSANGDTWTKNYYLYHDPAAVPGQPGARFEIIHWDADTVFGITFDGTPVSTLEEHAWRGWDAFSGRMFDNIREYRLPYLDAYRAALESGTLALDPLKARVQALRDRLAICIETDLAHWKREADVQQEYTRLEEMVAERHQIMLPRVKQVRSWD